MGAATQIVEVSQAGAYQRKEPRKVRISSNVKRAIDQMVHHGSNRAEAAEFAGIKDHALYSALRLPHVLAYMREQIGVIRTSASARTVARVDRLADAALSEHVQLEANKWIAGLEGIQPIQRSETTHNFGNVGPGLVILMQAPEAVRVIDGLSHEVGSPKLLSHLPARVPHPSEGTRAGRADLPGIIEAEEVSREGKNGVAREVRGSTHAPQEFFPSEEIVVPPAQVAAKKFLPGDKCRAQGRKLAPRTALKRKQVVARAKRKAAVAEWQGLSRAERRRRLLEE